MAGVLARPAEPDQRAPVVHHEHQVVEAEARAQALDVLDVVLPRAGRVGRRVAEARQVGRDAVPARAPRRAASGAPPHERGLRVAVQHQHRPAVGRPGLPVRDSLRTPAPTARLHRCGALARGQAGEQPLERRAQHLVLEVVAPEASCSSIRPVSAATTRRASSSGSSEPTARQPSSARRMCASCQRCSSPRRTSVRVASRPELEQGDVAVGLVADVAGDHRRHGGGPVGRATARAGRGRAPAARSARSPRARRSAASAPAARPWRRSSRWWPTPARRPRRPRRGGSRRRRRAPRSPAGWRAGSPPCGAHPSGTFVPTNRNKGTTHATSRRADHAEPARQHHLRGPLPPLGDRQLEGDRDRLLARRGAVADRLHRARAQGRLLELLPLLLGRGRGGRRPLALRGRRAAGGAEVLPHHPAGRRGAPRGLLQPLHEGGRGRRRRQRRRQPHTPSSPSSPGASPRSSTGS